MDRFVALLRRELRLALRTGADAWITVAFFAVAVAIFPFGIGPDPNILARVASGIIGVTALLAALLSVERQFQADFDDGNLDQLALAPIPLELVCGAKMAAHWILTGLPLTATAPLLAAALGLPGPGLAVLVPALVPATLLLSLLGGIGGALTLGARRSSVLIAVIILPLLIPVLVFSIGAVEAATVQQPVRPNLLILLGLCVLALPLAPITAAAAVRQALR